MEKVAVTGGLGFIGSHICEHFLQSRFQVSIIDNAEPKCSPVSELRGVEIHNASILDQAALKKAFGGAKFVFHHAAQVSVPYSIENPSLNNQINVKGTQNVLQAALECGASRVIIASSSAVYGNNLPPLREAMRPDPLSPYAESKLENEKMAKEYYEKHGLETVCLRYFNVYGPRQNPDSAYAAVIPRFISALKSGQRPVIYGDGLQTRDFVYVKDVVRANVLASLAESKALGKKFNIASGRPITIMGLLGKICAATGFRANPEFRPERKGDIKNSYADISLASKLLLFKPQYSLERGLRETIRSF